MSLTRRARSAAFVTACAVGVPMALSFSSVAIAATSPASSGLTVLTDTATAKAAGWVSQAYDCNDANGDWITPSQTFTQVAGASLGQGALELAMGSFSGQTEMFRSTNLDGAKLADVSALGYSTFEHSTDAQAGIKQPMYMRLTVDPDGDGDLSNAMKLYFEPALNPGQGDIKNDVWQSWDAGRDATWSTTGGPEAPTTLAQFSADNPNAKITADSNGGGLTLIGGCAGRNQMYSTLGVDGVTATVAGKTSLWDFDVPSSSATHTVPVKDAKGLWNESAYNYAGDGSTAAVDQRFVLGPNVPVAGKGSREMLVGDNPDVTQFWRTTALDGKPVDAVRALHYSTFEEHIAGKAGADLQQPAYLRLSIDSDGPDSKGVIAKDTTLNFEPANNPTQGAVKNGVWQTWDAFGGQLRVVESNTETADSQLSLVDFMARHPKAVFAENAKAFGGKGALSLVVGSGGDGQRNGRFYVDAVKVGLSTLIGGKPVIDSTTSDFEPTYTVPTGNYAKRIGAGNVTLTGTAGVGDSVEVRLLKNGNYATLAGTAKADSNGHWSFTLPVRERAYYRAFLAGTYGTTNISSAAHQVDVQFGVGVALSTSGGWTYGKVTLNPALGNVPVRLDVVVNNRWVTVARGVTGSTGTATLKWDSVRGRGYTVRAVASSTSTVLGNGSAARWIRSS